MSDTLLHIENTTPFHVQYMLHVVYVQRCFAFLLLRIAYTELIVSQMKWLNSMQIPDNTYRFLTGLSTIVYRSSACHRVCRYHFQGGLYWFHRNARVCSWTSCFSPLAHLFYNP